MGKKCYICGRKPTTKDASRSHAMNQHIKRQSINMQITRDINNIKRDVCTRCKKTINKDEKKAD